MLNYLKGTFIFIGAITSFTILLFLIITICNYIIALIKEIIRRYKYRHRFGKPPIAKCYCKDCERWNVETHKCYKFDKWHTADCWFCWDARPKKNLE